MCARYTLRQTSDQIALRFQAATVIAETEESYNIAPTESVAVVTEQAGVRSVEAFRWGLIPSWAKDAGIGARMINARAETLAEKPAFRSLLKRRRCLVPADGFYEWMTTGEGKQPLYFHLAENEMFAFAGLWDIWHGPKGPVRSVTLVTTRCNELVSPVHDRMPVMMLPENEKLWLDPGVQDAGALTALLQPYPPERMAVYPVSRRVNVPTYKAQEAVLPIVTNSA